MCKQHQRLITFTCVLLYWYNEENGRPEMWSQELYSIFTWEDICVLSQNGAKMYWLPDIRVFPSPFWNFWALVYGQEKWV